MRIGIVNDLLVIAELLRRAVISRGEHEVLWVARNGEEAVAACARQTPDLVLMDLYMPVMDGVEATRRIMQTSPCAILVVTATVEGSVGLVFEALGAGAIDAVDTPVLGGSKAQEGARLLLAKIEMMSRIIGSYHDTAHLPRVATAASGRGGEAWLFALGTSAGGPAALAEILGALPAGVGASIVAIPHLDRHFAPGLANWLGKQISLPVRLAQAGDRPEPGIVLLPDRDDHLVLTAQGTLAYTAEPKDYVYRPSIDVFFNSVVEHWKGHAAGVLLTGMGRDGAQGLKKMREAHFATFAQDQRTSAVYGMPKAAAQIGAAEKILPLSKIASVLERLL